MAGLLSQLGENHLKVARQGMPLMQAPSPLHRPDQGQRQRAVGEEIVGAVLLVPRLFAADKSGKAEVEEGIARQHHQIDCRQLLNLLPFTPRSYSTRASAQLTTTLPVSGCSWRAISSTTFAPVMSAEMSFAAMPKRIGRETARRLPSP